MIIHNLRLNQNRGQTKNPLPVNFAKNFFAVTDTNNKAVVYEPTKLIVYPSENKITLTITATTTADQPKPNLTVSYTDPTKNDDFYAIQDTLGNDAISFTGINVINV